MTLLWLALAPAWSTEVVWLSPPSDFDRDRVAQQADAKGEPLAPIDLRAAATRWSSADQDAYDTLDATLTDVRNYETTLDGELVIMRDLMVPIDSISVIRNEADRNKLFGALAYQGFAVNRFFSTRLAEDEQAADYRVELDGVVIEKPWVDAVALDPKREITPYDIAEAPQRVAYAKVAEVVTGALPASITPVNLPPGAVLKVDGRGMRVGPAGNFKLTPGRHLAHVELEGRVLARWTFRVAPGEAREIGPELTQEQWTAFIDNIGWDSKVPEPLLPSIEAMGGEVWVARPTDKDPEVFAITSEGVSEVKLEKIQTEAPGSQSPFTVVVGAQGGWFYGGDFLLQNPIEENQDDRAVVNAPAMAVLAAADLNISGFHVSAGVQAWATLGEDHFALTGTRQMRIRPYPHLGLGIRYVQATAGFLFPYHTAFGGRAMIPIVDPLEIHLSGLYGLAGELNYPDAPKADAYESGDVRTITGGIGLRF